MWISHTSWGPVTKYLPLILIILVCPSKVENCLCTGLSKSVNNKVNLFLYILLGKQLLYKARKDTKSMDEPIT